MPTRPLDPQRLERQIRLAGALPHCDGPGLKRLTLAALTWLETNHRAVNALNVFPVPDGDTGTNMLLTMQAAWKEIAASSETNVSQVAHAVAHGALMGARGNSGVILSQVWRGFARGLGSLETFDAGQLAQAMRQACDTAYRGVGKPVEGTILTVIKDIAAAAEAAGETDLRRMLEQMVEAAHTSVARTPDLLPVLKQAGVVDAGGKGLAFVLEGMLRYLRGQALDTPSDEMPALLSLQSVGAAMEAVEPGQEWETVVDFRPHGSLDLPALYSRLEQLGTSIQVGEGDGVVRMHIHLLKTNRFAPIELAEDMGTVTNVHMENLLDQMSSQAGGAEPLSLAEVEPGQIAVVAVSPGHGLSRIFGSLGVAAIVSGGQTMNPSTQDILETIGAVPAERVIILPNNKNILPAAQQAKEISVKQVAIVPTRTVPQGIAALLNYSREGDLEQVRAAMQASAQDIESGEVTRATRSVELDGLTVAEGQVIGLHNGTLRLAGDDLDQVVLDLLQLMGAPQRELITLYYGAEVSAEQAQAMAQKVSARLPDQTVEFHSGGQPYYHYLLSAE